jgi:hypothetical protein
MQGWQFDLYSDPDKPLEANVRALTEEDIERLVHVVVKIQPKHHQLGLHWCGCWCLHVRIELEFRIRIRIILLNQ